MIGGRRSLGTSTARNQSAERRGQRASLAEAVQVVAFSVGEGEYAVDIMRVKEIINPVPVTRVPKAPPFIEGVVELRGAILPIIDMRKRFDLPATALGRVGKFVIAAVDLGHGAAVVPPSPKDEKSAAPAEPVTPLVRVIVGLIVDAVWEPLRVARSEVRPAPLLAGGREGYFSGVIHHRGHIVMLINLDAVLSSSEKITLAGLRGPEVPSDVTDRDDGGVE